MSDIDVKRAKTAKGRRILEARAPKLVENPKTILYVHGKNCSQTVQHAFKDLNALTRPNSKLFSRKHDYLPFEDESAIESMSSKNDTSLFLIGTHNKKRPDNIVLARMFDFRLLDMVEVGVEKYVPMSEFKGEKNFDGNKPCLVFNGHAWEGQPNFTKLKSVFIDIFRGAVVPSVNLAGLDHVISFTVGEDDDTIYLRHYKVHLKKSGSRLPLVDLAEIGPAIDLKIRRTQWAADDLMKEALRQPKATQAKKVKNIEFNEMGEKLGRVHMQKQDYSELQTRKMKGLKRSKAETDGTPVNKTSKMEE